MNIWFVLLLNSQSLAISFNQPKFCANASWNPNAITFANSNTIGFWPFDIFITINNSIYVPNRSAKQLVMWLNASTTPTHIISLESNDTNSVFAAEANDVYFDYTWNSISGIRKLTSNETPVMETCPRCYDIFIDVRNNIYCSINHHHQIIKKSLNNSSDRMKRIAGTGTPGDSSYMLDNPNGIFVDTNFDLYVADHFNGRIQLFQLGQINGITVVGITSSSTTIILKKPTAIVLDANRYFFIADYGDHRIIRSGPNGFGCLFGCDQPGSEANRLNEPRSISFDSFGNLFIVDFGNHRIQKFDLISNSCNETTTSNISTMTNLASNQSTLVMTKSSNGIFQKRFVDISYNQPQLDPLTVWNSNGITFADINTLGSNPYSIFIDKHNTIYVAGRNIHSILIWKNNSINVTTTIDTHSANLDSIFVTSNGDIYISNSISTHQINRWTLNNNGNEIAAYFDGESFGVFVDINNTLYFSVRDQHKVISQLLNSTSHTLTIMAGIGCSGNALNMLNRPHGIFVDDNFDLYVADSGNDRIQLFRSGTSNAITIAGNGTKNDTITLKYPSSVVLDADKYLFIVDYGHHRIVGSGPYGFRCIIGCTGLSNSISNTFNMPTNMAFDSYGNIYVVDEFNHRIQKFLRLNNTNTPSYNQPTFCENATWDQHATTLANTSTIGTDPHALFIDNKNVMYTVNQQNGQIHVWLNDTTSPAIILYGSLLNSKAIFVTANGDIYVDHSSAKGRVDKFTLNSNDSIPVMSSLSESCHGLFVDIANNLYCSVDTVHQVFKKWLGDNLTISTRVAGNGSQGSNSNMLHHPNGIFVDTNFDLYVADYGNHRIQLFHLGELHGKTVAGDTSSDLTISLNNPVNVILDGNKYLFIADHDDHRIVGQGPNGFRCIVGCFRRAGSSADDLHGPRSIAFDSFGNLFIVDRYNHRIQRFAFLRNRCNEITTVQPSSTPSHFDDVTKITTFYRLETITITQQTSLIGDANGVFIVPKCSDSNTIGKSCNIQVTICSMLNPCENQGTCINTNDSIYGYRCICRNDFDGSQCQYDGRICKSNTCWNNGTCNAISNTTFECLCRPGWTGKHCENMINYCHNVTCENNGVCRSLFMNYKCECLGESFSGPHCEKVATKIVALRYVSKSVGYIGIIFLVITALFFVIMDGLKYIFGVDVTKEELERIRREKDKKKLSYRSTNKKSTNTKSTNTRTQIQPTIVKNNKLFTTKL